MTHERARELSERIAREVIARVRPNALVDRAWTDVAPLLGPERGAAIDLVAIGKASVGLAGAVVPQLGARVARGIVLAPEGREGEIRAVSSGEHSEVWGRLLVRVVDHPVPTVRNVGAAEEVERLVREGARAAGERVLLVLVSGGGSAHLSLPAPGVTLGGIADVSTRVMRAGATIGELNTVRKHLERLKGGGLSRLARGGDHGRGYTRVVSMVVSDVVGDDLSAIASGPLSPDPTTYADAIAVLRERGIGREDAPDVWEHLERGVAGERDETPKAGDGCFACVEQLVIGSNRDAVIAAEDVIAKAGVGAIKTRHGVSGEAGRRGAEMVGEMKGLGRGEARAMVWGGETTVTVGATRGAGGRNQEFVLAAAREMSGTQDAKGLMVLSFGTDGVDGSTDAAGAFATSGTWQRITARGLDPGRLLREHDSHRALDSADALVRTGPTGTNVNDVMVAIADPSGDCAREGER